MKMRRDRLAICAAILVLTSCSSPSQTAADTLKAVVSEKMKDPTSTRFIDLRLDHEVLCGAVNSKNSFGAYAGADRFWATKAFAETRAEAISRDDTLAGTPANPQWKRSTIKFDEAWARCQKDGVPVR